MRTDEPSTLLQQKLLCVRERDLPANLCCNILPTSNFPPREYLIIFRHIRGRGDAHFTCPCCPCVLVKGHGTSLSAAQQDYKLHMSLLRSWKRRMMTHVGAWAAGFRCTERGASSEASSDLVAFDQRSCPIPGLEKLRATAAGNELRPTRVPPFDCQDTLKNLSPPHTRLCLHPTSPSSPCAACLVRSLFDFCMLLLRPGQESRGSKRKELRGEFHRKEGTSSVTSRSLC